MLLRLVDLATQSFAFSPLYTSATNTSALNPSNCDDQPCSTPNAVKRMLPFSQCITRLPDPPAIPTSSYALLVPLWLPNSQQRYSEYCTGEAQWLYISQHFFRPFSVRSLMQCNSPSFVAREVLWCYVPVHHPCPLCCKSAHSPGAHHAHHQWGATRPDRCQGKVLLSST
jgi:hypothetical protein